MDHEAAEYFFWNHIKAKLELYIDIISHSLYTPHMRWQACIVLVAITLSIIVPPYLPLACRGGQAAIGTLDVCHSAVPALSSNGDMPCAIACPCLPLPFAPAENMRVHHSSIQAFSLIRNQERPPKA
jgi:hypothetical protein